STLSEQSNMSGWPATSALSPDGRLAALANPHPGTSPEPGIDLVDVETAKVVHTLTGHGRDMRVLTFSADGRRLASAGQDDLVKIWDVATGQEVLSRPSPRNVIELRFTRDGKKLIAV